MNEALDMIVALSMAATFLAPFILIGVLMTVVACRAFRGARWRRQSRRDAS